jgi:hypothetical protein
VDHLDGTAGEAEGHRPKAAGPRPVHQLVEIADDEAASGDLARDAADDRVLVRTRRKLGPVPDQLAALGRAV